MLAYIPQFESISESPSSTNSRRFFKGAMPCSIYHTFAPWESTFSVLQVTFTRTTANLTFICFRAHFCNRVIIANVTGHNCKNCSVLPHTDDFSRPCRLLFILTTLKKQYLQTAIFLIFCSLYTTHLSATHGQSPAKTIKFYYKAHDADFILSKAHLTFNVNHSVHAADLIKF